MKPITHLIYLDANNIYGWAMSQPLPTHGFRWLTQSEIDQLVLAQLADNAPDGYIYAYPLAPERLTIDETMLSPLQRTFPKHHQQTTTKLSPNLHAKLNYIEKFKVLSSAGDDGNEDTPCANFRSILVA